MSEHAKPHLISADRLDGSIVVTFDDGRCAIYSSELLYATLPQARELHDSEMIDTQELASQTTRAACQDDGSLTS